MVGSPTRDRFMVDGEGFYHHCGRVDDLFKVGGKWVSPGEVERALTAHEAVWECAVIGADDDEGLIKPLAFVVTNVGQEGGRELEAELKDYVKQRSRRTSTRAGSSSSMRCRAVRAGSCCATSCARAAPACGETGTLPVLKKK